MQSFNTGDNVYVVCNPQGATNLNFYFYLKGTVLDSTKSTKNTIQIQIGTEKISLKGASLLNDGFKTTKSVSLDTPYGKVSLNSNDFVRLYPQTDKMNELFSKFFIDPSSYPKLENGLKIVVDGKIGKAIYGHGNLGSIPRFLPNDNSISLQDAQPITTYTLPSEQQILDVIETNFNRGRFESLYHLNTPVNDLIIVQVTLNDDESIKFLVLQTDKGQTDWLQKDSTLYNSYTDALINTIANQNSKKHFAPAVNALIGE